MIGALCHYVASAEAAGFQPMKPNFGLMPPLGEKQRSKRQRYQAYTERALAALQDFVRKHSILPE